VLHNRSGPKVCITVHHQKTRTSIVAWDWQSTCALSADRKNTGRGAKKNESEERKVENRWRGKEERKVKTQQLEKGAKGEDMRTRRKRKEEVKK